MPGRYATILAIGLTAGLLSGVFGIGGGIIIVPALILLLKFPPESAVATSLGAMLLPVGLFAVREYHRQGMVDWKAAAALGLGILASSWLGAKLVTSAPAGQWLTRAFGVLLILVGLRFCFKN